MRLPLAAALIALALLGAGCLPGGGQTTLEPITLAYWRADDDVSAFTDASLAYRALHPNVTIEFKSFRAEDYERELVEALAEDRGPDLFSIPNVWLRGWRQRILPLPKETVIPTPRTDDRGRTAVVTVKTPSMTIRRLRDDYVDVVATDVIAPTIPSKEGEQPQEAVWGLPLSADTLALFVNRAALRKASITAPATTWRELQEHVEKLTLRDQAGNVTFSGAAIGGSKNVRHATELLTAIMSQNGSQMTDDRGFATFERSPAGFQGSIPPGLEALLFYQGFATPGTTNFTWDAGRPDSLEAFVTGGTAYYFGFPSDLPRIRARAPRLEVGVAPLPQIDPSRRINVAKYPVETVSKKTKHPNEAWDLVQFLNASEHADKILAAIKRPAALRALIPDQIALPDVSIFAGQVLTARSWYRGNDYSAVERAFAKMIDARPSAERPEYGPIISAAVSAVNATVR